MGFFDGLIGNASEYSVEAAQEQYGHLLSENEKIDKAYKLIRDMFIFTNRRLILIDVQGMTGKKIECRSIPYSKITSFSVETAGNFDLDAELKIWVSGISQPIQKQFNKTLNIYEVQAQLASHVI